MKPLFMSLTVAASLMASAATAGVLRLGHDQPEDFGYNVAGDILNEAVHAADADYSVKTYPGAQLGSEPAMMESVMAGNIDMSISTAPNASSLVPELGIFSVSYIFDDMDHLLRVLHDEEFQKMIDEKIAARDLGIKRVGYFISGLRNVYADRAVSTPDDMKGMKFRVMASPIESQIWGALGTSPLNIPSSDVYTGMQTGLVQGAETTAGAYVMNRYNEVAPFYSLTEHQWSISLLLASEASLDKAPEAVREAIAAAGNDIIDQTSKTIMDRDIKLIGEMNKAYGVTVTEVDKSKFQEQVADIQDEVAAELGVQPILERIRALR